MSMCITATIQFTNKILKDDQQTVKRQKKFLLRNISNTRWLFHYNYYYIHGEGEGGILTTQH